MTKKNERLQQPVAIIGMNGMFANSPDLKGYWQTLANGIDCITDPPQSHCRLNDLLDDDPKKPDHIYCNRGGFLPVVPFDPTEFGIPPAAIEATDTSQLLSLVATKRALADAGYGPDRKFDRSTTSVILGVTGTQELVISLGSRLGHPHWRKALENKGLSDQQKESIIDDISGSYVPWQESSFPGLLGNVVAGRICNRLNLGGTNCVVDAACASSLSAIHLALMELETHKSQMVITGGVDTLNDGFMHMCFSKTGVLSHSGDARPFSADADGTVLGEGIGILVLKRLEDARNDGDRIYAVIRGVGSSSDGKSQSIYAPNADGQSRALREAYRVAGVSPDTVEVVEAHGTGTRVGDEVEFSALREVFSDVNPNGNRCALGSVKSMIGHTKAAAGSAGMIKSALSLYNKVMLPTLKAETPDPKLNIESSPFYLNTVSRPWFRPPKHPRRCGVSSFGFGGSNFHVVLEEYHQDKNEIAWDGSVEIMAFSGQTANNIIGKIKNAQTLLSEKFSSTNISRESKRLRGEFKTDHMFRLVIVVETNINENQLNDHFNSALKIVRSDAPADLFAKGIHFSTGSDPSGKVAFLFPGQGSQYVNMGSDLTCRFPAAMKAVENFGSRFEEPRRFYNTVFPRSAFSNEEKNNQSADLRRTDFAQPAIGAVSMAMLSVLRHFNVRPDVTCGHSYGELPALCAAGWIDAETLSNLSVQRGRLMAEAAEQSEGGAMMAVKAPVSQLESLAQTIPGIVLANINSPEQVVLSGTVHAIKSAKKSCKEKGYRTVDLPVAAAFHSPLVKEAAEPFSRVIGESSISPSKIPVFANVTGSPYPTIPSQVTDLLSRQLTSSVQFQRMIENLYASGVRTFVEVGPKSVLTGLVRSTLIDKAISCIAVDSSSGKNSGMKDLAHTIGRLACLGFDVDLKRWENGTFTPNNQKMSIPLSGANYRMPQKKKPIAPIAPDTASVNKPAMNVPQTASKREPEKRMSENKTMNTIRPTIQAVVPTGHVRADDAVGSGHQDALSIVQKGLESIQSLQQHTAQVHQTFLETQAQASRTLQEMMVSTRMLMGETPESTTVTKSFEPTVAPEPEKADVKAMAPIPPANDHERQNLVSPPTPVAPIESIKKVPAANEAVSTTLLSVVSELTGYPEDMLGMEMDIEGDLGIDSIKRVEILSAMEERMPHLPQITPDQVGALKTLGQICDFLSAGEPNQAPTANSEPTAKEDPSAVRTQLVSVVAQLTGYPEEMLGMEMDIEGDLGIDSIKRVEILSAMEECMPHLPQITPDQVGALKTLGQICDFLSAGEPNQAPTANSEPTAKEDPSAVRTQLVSIVAQLTGYPEEMLGMEMDIEGDLGIDSIKRVEILSAMEECMPHLPQITPDQVGALKTLGQICDFLSAGEPNQAPTANSEPTAKEDPSAVRTQLVSIVAQLTGYPEEMLGMEMDIEGDLGIDSIKRVEILSTMEERMPHLPQITPDQVGALKTLGQICDYLAGKNTGISPERSKIRTTDEKPAALQQAENVPRQIIDVIPVSKRSDRFLPIESDRWIGVLCEEKEVARVIAEQLEKRQIPGRILSSEQVNQCSNFSGIAGLIIVAPMDPKTAFLAAQNAAPDLLEASRKGNALFATVTKMDGTFGFSGKRFDNPEQGGLAGLSKTAALEWESVLCRALDLSPDFPDAETAAASVLDELFAVSDQDPVEIGLAPDRRIVLQPIPAQTVKAPSRLNKSDVVLITGGGRGVTAACALEIARETKAAVALIGRSGRPTEIPAWLNINGNEGEIKKAIIEHQFAGSPPTPKALQAEYRKQKANIELTQTINQIKAMGVSVGYFSVDVTNKTLLENTIEAVRDQFGPITAMVHGAGVLHDRLIVDKNIEQFEAVYGVKVNGFKNLLAVTKTDPLRHMILFSSVAARTGNTGQCDYAMANEVLNKMAHWEADRRSDCRVTAINWGPWDGGMVTPSLKKVFSEKQVSLIPLETGARMMVAEMQNMETGPVEVMIGTMLTTTAELHSKPLEGTFELLERRELDIQRYPVLSSHIIGGKPVVPFALMGEWIGHGAVKENPGLSLHGIDDFRLLSGIRIDQEKKLVRLLAGKPKRSDGIVQVEVELRNGVSNGKDVIHSRAKALLVDRLPDAPVFKANGKNGTRAYTKDLKKVYGEILFHGAQLRAIKKIETISDNGMKARLTNAPKPAAWMQDPINERWMADPMVLDGAFQMAILWCFEQSGAVCLPSYARAYRQYRRTFPASGVTAVMEVTGSTGKKMIADFTFLDNDDMVVATLSGYEATVDMNLIHSFKENELAPVIAEEIRC